MQELIKPVKIEVSNVRKLSVDEFAEKVNEEKTNHENDHKSITGDSDSETKEKKDGGIFGKMKTIEEALAEKEQKKKEK